MTSTADAVGPLVVLVQNLRPQWDTRGIRPVLAKLVADGHDLADIAWAAIRTAEDRGMRTPAAIAQTDSPHWRPTVRDRESPDQRARRIQAQLDERAALERARQRLALTPEQREARRERIRQIRDGARQQTQTQEA